MQDDLHNPLKLHVNRLIVTIMLVDLLTRIYKEGVAWGWEADYPVIVISLN